MTIEEKVKTLVNQICNETIIYNGNPDKDSYTQAILELMKPMSKEVIDKIIRKQAEQYYKLPGNAQRFIDSCDDCELADAILAEWEKGQTL